MYWHHIWGNLIPRVLSYLAPKRTLGTRLHLGLVAILPGGLGYRNWPQLWPCGALGTFTILPQQIKWPLAHTLYSPSHFFIFFMRNASFFSILKTFFGVYQQRNSFSSIEPLIFISMNKQSSFMCIIWPNKELRCSHSSAFTKKNFWWKDGTSIRKISQWA